MRTVTDYTHTELAAALLTPAGVIVPRYGRVPEHRVNIDHVVARLADRHPLIVSCAAVAAAAGDHVEAGRILDATCKRIAEEMAQELIADWVEDSA